MPRRTTKRNKAPVTSSGPPLPLPEVVDLPVPTRLRTQLKSLWLVLRDDISEVSQHRLLQSTVEEWTKGNARLASKALDGDDDALIDLVRADPRYLGSELLTAKVWLWRLTVAYDTKRLAKHPNTTSAKGTPTKRQHQRAGEAKAKLERLGKAISFVLGGGNRLWTDLDQLLNDYEFNLAAVEKAKALIQQAIKSRQRINKKQIVEDVGWDDCDHWGDPDSWVTELVNNSRRTRGLAVDITAADYSISAAALRNLLTKARRRST